MNILSRWPFKSRTLASSRLTKGPIGWLRRFVSRHLATQYLRSNPETKLHVGCGPCYLEGWLNADIDLRQRVDIFLDAREPLPFEANQFQFVFAEHLIEHLSFDEGRRFCREVYRVLRPGGVLRLSTPDLQFLINYYEDPSEAAKAYTEYHTREFLRETVESKALVISNFFHDFGHRIIYDWELLVRLLREEGFLKIERRQVGESPHPQLRSIERHGDHYPFNGEESMLLEAVKPFG